MKKRFKGTKQGFNRMLFMLTALVLIIALLPTGAMAEDSAITVSGADGATTVGLEQPLQMVVTPSGSTVTWSVYDANASGEVLETQNNATIDSTGLLTGVKAGFVSVTAETPEGQSDSIQVVVGPAGAPTPALELVQGTAVYTVPLGKVKITIPFSPMVTYWATSGKPDAEQTPYIGEPFSDVQDTYTYNISVNPFVPASAGDTVFIVGKNVIGDETIVYFQALVVNANDAINIGTNQPPIADTDTIQIKVGSYSSYPAMDTNVGNVKSFFHDLESERMMASNIVIADPSIATVSPYYDGYYNTTFNFTGLKLGKTTVSFVLEDTTGDKIPYTMKLDVLKPRTPFETEDQTPFTDAPITLTYNPDIKDETGFTNDNIDSIEVNGVVVAAEDYTLFENEMVNEYGNSYEQSGIKFRAGVLSAGTNTIVVKSEGFIDAKITQEIIDSNDWYYIHTFTDTTSGGLIATAQLVMNMDTADTIDRYSGYNRQASIVFQLMNGDEPIDMVSFTTEDVEEYATYHAQFNLADIAANPDYTVRAFLITGDNTDDNNIGYNLATEVSQEVYDEKYQDLEAW